MDRFFSVLQTTASCCKRSKIGLVPLLSGVPKGTVLGPLLFSLYINDISTDIDSEIRLFADDCACYREIKDTEDTLKLQKDIDQLGCWAREWGMRFQPVKCIMMQITRKRIKKIHASYTLEGMVLENVENIKYLGSLSQMIYDLSAMFALRLMDPWLPETKSLRLSTRGKRGRI